MPAVNSTRLTAARLALAAILFVFAADYLLAFMPEAPVSAAGGAFLEALLATGYMFPLVKSVEVTGAALLLSRRYAPAALLLLAPVILNIGLYHAVLDPNGRWIAAALVGLEAFLLWSYRSVFRRLVDAPGAITTGVVLTPPAHAGAAVPATRS